MSGSHVGSIECQWYEMGGEGEPARCGLLQKLTGLVESPQCAVRNDACSECLKWYPPDEEHLNPVVASLLYKLSLNILESGGLPGCNVEKAEELQQVAFAAIPHEYDAVPITNQVDLQKNTSIADIGHLIPRPRHRCGSTVKEWSVAVTTAPRKQATLDRCLKSLIKAGWISPRLIIDGDVTLTDAWNHLPITRRNPQIGAWPSYYLTLIELIMRQPAADAYMIVQDDVVLFEHPSLKSYLESILWPGRREGIVSLFCSRAYAQQSRGWHRIDQPLVWGGQALIFSKETAINLISDLEIVRHRFSKGDLGLSNIDGLIGKWAFETGTPVYMSSPSLSQHIGHISSLWKSPKAFVNRSAETFAGNYQISDSGPKSSAWGT